MLHDDEGRQTGPFHHRNLIAVLKMPTELHNWSPFFVDRYVRKQDDLIRKYMDIWMGSFWPTLYVISISLYYLK